VNVGCVVTTTGGCDWKKTENEEEEEKKRHGCSLLIYINIYIYIYIKKFLKTLQIGCCI